MIQAPEKPKNYLRNQFIICLFVCLVIWTLFLITAPSFLYVSVALSFYYLADYLWFKDYNAQKREHQRKVAAYQAAQREAARVDSLYAEKSSVNENIAHYRKQLQENKANKTWWQFWI